MTSSPATLHLLAHQAQHHARTAEDWWDGPLDTALAALSAARHPPAYREEARQAVNRLSRWQREGKARRVSGDIAALALAAAAAHDLAERQPHLEEAAVDGVEQLAGRSGPAAPALHLALAAWALDRVIPDRESRPWPALRDRFEHHASNVHGLDAQLTRLAATFSAARFDAGELVRGLLAVPVNPNPNDGAVLLWLLTAALERCAPELSANDSGLLSLTDRRTELVTRLAQEIDASTFEHPDADDFDPDSEPPDRLIEFLSPMEALLLDLSLASSHPENPWLRFEEAESLFGDTASELRGRLARRTSQLISLVGLLAGAVVALVLVQEAAKTAACIAAGITVSAALLCLAGAIQIRTKTTLILRAGTALAAAIAVAAAFTTFNQARTHPWSDAAEIVTDLIMSAVVALITTLATRS